MGLVETAWIVVYLAGTRFYVTKKNITTERKDTNARIYLLHHFFLYLIVGSFYKNLPSEFSSYLPLRGIQVSTIVYDNKNGGSRWILSYQLIYFGQCQKTTALYGKRRRIKIQVNTVRCNSKYEET